MGGKISLHSRQTEGYSDGTVHLLHLLLAESSHVLPKAALVDGADLLQEDDTVPAEANTASGDVDVGGEPGFSGLAGDGGGDDRWGMAVSRVILDDEHRTGTALFAAHHRTKIGVKNVAAFHTVIHIIHTPPEDSRRYGVLETALCNAVL